MEILNPTAPVKDSKVESTHWWCNKKRGKRWAVLPSVPGHRTISNDKSLLNKQKLKTLMSQQCRQDIHTSLKWFPFPTTMVFSTNTPLSVIPDSYNSGVTETYSASRNLHITVQTQILPQLTRTHARGRTRNECWQIHVWPRCFCMLYPLLLYTHAVIWNCLGTQKGDCKWQTKVFWYSDFKNILYEV